MIKIGKVINYYEKTGVAIVELTNPLTLGEKIKFVRGGNDIFSQVVESIQIGHKKVSGALAGEVIGLVANEFLEKETEVYKT